MGMDLSGKAPINEKGKEIHFSIFSWPNYADFMQIVAPDLFAKIEYPYSNDGAGLDAHDAKLMGEKLITAINSEIGVKFIESVPERPTTFTREGASNFRKLIEPDRVVQLGEFMINSGGFEIW